MNDRSPIPSRAPDDQTLLDRLRAGRQDAFESLYAAHRDWALRLARRLTGDADAALDITQEVFVEMARRPPRLMPDGSLRGWVYAAIRHAAIHRRRRSERFRIDQRVGRARRAEKPPLEGPAETHEPLRRALAALPDEQRETLLLRTVHALSTCDAAAALGVPEGTIKSRLSKALATLRAREDLRDLFPDD